MATRKARRLKVFATRLGFYETVVAAPSRAAALRAWGVHQDLFANGQAEVVTDPKTIEAATGHPEIPLRRGVGSADPFTVDPPTRPSVPAAPETATRGRRATARAKPEAPPRPAADRSALDAAEKALRTIDDARRREEERLRRRQDDLDAERAARRAAYGTRRKAAAAAVAKARAAFRKAGGPG